MNFSISRVTRGVGSIAALAGIGFCLSTSAVVGVVAAPQAPAAGVVPTFSHDVAPILYARCVGCHRPGEVAPMSLISFKEVRPWAKSIREKVATRVMPPWHADTRYGKFRNDLSLPQREIDTLIRWVDGGAPEGNPAEMPKLPAFAEGWQLGTPDQVFEMQADYEIPARGTIDYQYFEVPTNFAEDRWMQAGEVRPGDRAHVHHIIVYVRDPKPSTRPAVMSVRPILSSVPQPTQSPTAAQTPATAAPREAPAISRAPARAPLGGDAMLVNWAVGEDAPVFLPGNAKRIPAGATLIFQVHYTTNGTPGRDRSRLGLTFAKEPPAREIRTGLISNAVFSIPAGAPNHTVEAEAGFSEDVKVWSLHPHMHLRGKDMTFTATYPDGRQQILLSVPKFDFGWQTDYWLAEPLLLPKGSKIHVSAHFDNSAANKANPDPAATVRWGDQTWEEMMIGFFTYSVEGRPATPAQR
jgi:hypothetical protein